MSRIRSPQPTAPFTLLACRLRGRLISILKHQEAVEFERQKRQELHYESLPRRQSSRIAMTRIKRQSVGDVRHSKEIEQF